VFNVGRVGLVESVQIGHRRQIPLEYLPARLQHFTNDVVLERLDEVQHDVPTLVESPVVR
jgi:hypothetical protein